MLKVLERITPEKKDLEEIKKVLSKIMKIKNKKIELFIGGSYAKQTLVKRDKGYDVDIFVMFPYKMASHSHKLADYLSSILRKYKIKAIRLHGSRDYFQVKMGKVTIELVPILKIKKAEEAVNITDISPLHVSYVLNKIRKKKKLADEIRLAKSFCYATDCYGAESYIRGFSGYVLEVLVCYYGSFKKFLKQIVKWNGKDKIVIDPKKHYSSGVQALHSLNEAKIHSPIILIDPVQKDRNAAAALSFRTLEKFQKIVKEYLKKPKEEYFFKQEINIKKLENEAKKKKAKFITMKVTSSKNKADIAGAKTKKFYEYLKFIMKKNGFNVIKSIYGFSEKNLNAIYYFIYKEPNKEFLIEGPPLNINEKYIKKFKKRWKKTFVKNKRIYTKTTRKIFSVKNLVMGIPKTQLKDMFIKKIEIR
jgi:tRNA nucleotidyltransferase (CCA-adding enzyme)